MSKRHSTAERDQPKRAKKSQKEIDLEALLFGADAEDYNVLTHAGHELSDGSMSELDSPTGEKEGFLFSVDLGGVDNNTTGDSAYAGQDASDSEQDQEVRICYLLCVYI